MTNEEAIKIIKDYKTNDANHTLKIWFEALDLAIKALEERPQGKYTEMTLKDMICTLRTSQFERIELRDDYGNEIFTCSTDSSGLTPYLEYTVTEWFPHGAPKSTADFTVYVRESVEETEESVQSTGLTLY